MTEEIQDMTYIIKHIRTYLGVEQNWQTDHRIMKEELRLEFSKRIEQVLKTGLNSCNLVKAINIYAVPTLTYAFHVSKWSVT